MRPAFAAAGMELIEIDWRAPLDDFDGIALVLLGSAWDYQDHPAEFLARLEALEARGLIVCNSPEIVRWNTDKRYLQALAKAGARTIPTVWHDAAGRAEIIAAMDEFGAERVVAKRQIGAGGLGQHSFSRGALPDQDWQLGHPAIIQPFIPAIIEEGEHSLIFIAGTFSHGVTKRAAAGEYRIQSMFGGTEADFAASDSDIDQAAAILAAIPLPTPLYARIDMVRLPDGQLAVMEAEMIEPYLYPQQGPDLGEKLAKAVCTLLG